MEVHMSPSAVTEPTVLLIQCALPKKRSASTENTVKLGKENQSAIFFFSIRLNYSTAQLLMG